MLKKITISLISACVIAGTLLFGFIALYFAVPSRQSMAKIELADQVADPASEDTSFVPESSSDNSEEESNIYVADVYQSLTLRSQPSSSAEPVTQEGLAPLTQIELQEPFPSDTDYVYVKVLDGVNKDVFGYVNTEYITKLGEPTSRAQQEN